MPVKIYLGDRFLTDGVLIEDRVYARVADILSGLGYGYNWVPGDPPKVVAFKKPLTPNMDLDLRLPSFASVALLDRYVAGTPLAGLGKDWLAAEARWRVNAVFLCALACHESDFGRSRIARDKKNIYGLGAYDRDPYNSAKSYSSFRESIEDVCSLLVRQYLYPCGAYYNGPTPKGVNVKYSTDSRWAEKVVKHMTAIVEGLARAADESPDA